MEKLKLLKRIKLIHNLLEHGDTGKIGPHLEILKTMGGGERVDTITNKLEMGLYGEAFNLTGTYIADNHQVVTYVDPEAEILRTEIRMLAEKINKLDDEKAEIEKLINEFLVRHNRELGDIIIKILKIKKEVRRKEAEKIGSFESRKVYQEAEQDYNEYRQEYTHIRSRKHYELNEDDKRELKKRYRQASKLCHPDQQDAGAAEDAHKIFVELNDAYNNNDLVKVSRILEMLKSGKIKGSGNISKNEKADLRAEAERLRKVVADTEAEIGGMILSETYLTIMGIEDWEEYFGQTREELLNELTELETRYGKQ